MSYFNHIAIKDIKPDSPQLKDQRTQKTHTNKVQAKWVKETNMRLYIKHKSGNQIISRKKKNTRKYMKPSTEISLHRNNILNNPNKNKPKIIETHP